jgi:hypothetical protein
MSSQIWSRSTHAVRQTRQRSRTQRLLRLLTLRSSQDSSPNHPTPDSKPRNSFAAPPPPSDSAITLAAQCADPA